MTRQTDRPDQRPAIRLRDAASARLRRATVVATGAAVALGGTVAAIAAAGTHPAHRATTTVREPKAARPAEAPAPPLVPVPGASSSAAAAPQAPAPSPPAPAPTPAPVPTPAPPVAASGGS